mmetsp:Transcript_44361/g.73998  ORF Transcript_44361/g.73998 Transcript_44361/m.73998 type:complete len:376 (+) Transcript_44361:1498-2625(+)
MKKKKSRTQSRRVAIEAKADICPHLYHRAYAELQLSFRLSQLRLAEGPSCSSIDGNQQLDSSSGATFSVPLSLALRFSSCREEIGEHGGVASSSSSSSSTPSPLPSHHLPPLKKTTTTGLYCRNNSGITRTFTVYDAPTADDSPELLKAFNILHQKAFSDSSSPTPQSTAATHHHHHLPNVSSPVAPPHRLFSTEDHPVNKRKTGWSKQQQQQQQQQNSSSAASSSSSSSTLVPFTRSRSQPVPTCILTSNTPTQHQREEEEKNKQTARRGPWGRRDERLRCAICQHHIRRDSEETIAVLDCAHEYHEKCLHAFIEHERANANESYLCPVCRNDIQTVTFQNNETTSTCGRYPQRKRKIPIKSLILSCNKRKKTV